MSKRHPYPSDLTDDQWSLIRPFACPRRLSKVGHPVEDSRRDLVDAIFYLLRTDCQWRQLPHDFPRLKLVWADSAYERNDLPTWAVVVCNPVLDIVWRGQSASWCCTTAGWWSGRSPGWCGTAAWPATMSGRPE
jgi:transposase